MNERVERLQISSFELDQYYSSLGTTDVDCDAVKATKYLIAEQTTAPGVRSSDPTVTNREDIELEFRCLSSFQPYSFNTTEHWVNGE